MSAPVDTPTSLGPKRRSWKMDLMRLQGQLLRGREAVGLTQTELAFRLAVSRSTIQRWEDGRGTPNVDQLFRWADSVGIEITSKESVICDASAVPS